MDSHDYQSCDFTKLIYTRIYGASGWNRTSDSRFKRPLQYHFVTEAYGGDGETRTLIPLQVTGVQAQTDTNFWLHLHNGTPNEIQTHDARMKTVWLNRLPMGAYGGVRWT